jgi:hypothetical protein
MKYSSIEPLEPRIAPATLTLSNAQVVEGNSATKTLTFTATLSAAQTSDVSFILSTQNGTAVAGSDFVAKSAPVTIPASQTTATFSVTVNGDSTFEATESLFVNLTDLTGAPVTVVNDNPVFPTALATARGYIFNDDVQNLSATQAQWIDVDGDLVTMTVSKGQIPITNSALFTFVSAGTVGGKQLQRLDLQQFRSSFAGASISIVATKQAGFPDVSDGEVDVGFIKATTFDPDELRAVGIDLGNVTIDGDLAKITAGDSFATPAIAKLDVISLGTRGAETLATADAPADANGVVESKVLGPITSVVVRDDVNSFLRVIGAEYGVLGSLKIGGALQGVGTKVASGAISVSGRLGKATIGDIIGGTGANSGLLIASSLGNGSLGTITVTGSITGGAGDDSGQIHAPKIGNLKVGTIVGGTGTRSGLVLSDGTLGSVTMTGDLIGGTKADTGEIFAQGGIGAVKVGGKIAGDLGENSGSIRSGKGITSLSVAGTLAGADGAGSGSIQTSASVGAVSFGKDATTGDSITGGAGENSGLLDIGGNLASFAAAGNVRGAAANGSGAIVAAGTIGKLTITGSLIGGSSDATFLNKTGYLFAQHLTSVTIGGDIISGTAGTGGLADSGAIRADVIDALTVQGKLTGNAVNPVVIAATGLTNNLAIKSVKITGNVAFAEILAGYNDVTSAGNVRGEAASADASIGTVTFGGTVAGLDIVAGAIPLTNGFGTADDQLAHGTITGNIPVRDVASVISKIASVVFLSPTAITTNSSAHGIVAQYIAAVKIGTAAVPLQAGAGNDVASSPTDANPGIELGALNSNFRALELRLPL